MGLAVPSRLRWTFGARPARLDGQPADRSYAARSDGPRCVGLRGRRQRFARGEQAQGRKGQGEPIHRARGATSLTNSPT